MVFWGLLVIEVFLGFFVFILFLGRIGRGGVGCWKLSCSLGVGFKDSFRVF